MFLFVNVLSSFAISKFLGAVLKFHIMSTLKSLSLVWTSVEQPHANIYATVSTNQHIKPSIYSFLPKMLGVGFLLKAVLRCTFHIFGRGRSQGSGGLREHLAGGGTNRQEVSVVFMASQGAMCSGLFD